MKKTQVGKNYQKIIVSYYNNNELQMETCNICGGSRWTDALKQYNAGKMWCVPRKGTPEHAEVKLIMERLKNPKPPRKLRPKTGQAPQKRIEELTPTEPIRSMEEKPKRKLKPKAPVVEDEPKNWYEHKLWTDGKNTYELNPVRQKGKTFFWKKLDRAENDPYFGVHVRDVNPGSPPQKQLNARGLRPI